MTRLYGMENNAVPLKKKKKLFSSARLYMLAVALFTCCAFPCKCFAEYKACIDIAVSLPLKVLFRKNNNLLSDNDCWFQAPLRAIFKVADAVGQSSYNALVKSNFSIMIVAFGFAFWLASRILRYVSSLYPLDVGDFFTELAVGGFKVLVVVCFLEWGALEIFDHFIGVFVVTAGNVSTNMVLGDLKQLVCDVNPNGNACDFGYIDPNITGAEAIYLSVLNLLKAVNLRFRIAAAIGQGVTTAGWMRLWGILCVFHYGIIFTGIVIALTAFYFMFRLPLKMIDIALRLALLYALLPFFVAAWAFPVTRKYTKVAWGMVMYIVVYLLMFGVLSCVAASLLSAGIDDATIKTAVTGGVSEASKALLSDFIGETESGGAKFMEIVLGAFIAVKGFGTLASLAGFISDGNDMGIAEDKIGKALAGTLIKGGLAVGTGLKNHGALVAGKVGELHSAYKGGKNQARSGGSAMTNAYAGNGTSSPAAAVDAAVAAATGKGGGDAAGGSADNSYSGNPAIAMPTSSATDTGGAAADTKQSPKREDASASLSSDKPANQYAGEKINADKSTEERGDAAEKNAVEGAEKQGEKAVGAAEKAGMITVDEQLKALEEAKARMRSMGIDTDNKKAMKGVAEFMAALANREEKQGLLDKNNVFKQWGERKKLNADVMIEEEYIGKGAKKAILKSGGDDKQVKQLTETLVGMSSEQVAQLQTDYALIQQEEMLGREQFHIRMGENGYDIGADGNIAFKNEEEMQKYLEKQETFTKDLATVFEHLPNGADIDGVIRATDEVAKAYSACGGDIEKLKSMPEMAEYEKAGFIDFACSEGGSAALANIIDNREHEALFIAMTKKMAENGEEGDAGVLPEAVEIAKNGEKEDYYVKKEMVSSNIKGEEAASISEYDLGKISQRFDRLYKKLIEAKERNAQLQKTVKKLQSEYEKKNGE